jgi:sugar lactone lactonase YvrE
MENFDYKSIALAVAMVSVLIWGVLWIHEDISTGSVKLIMADVIDKKHEHIVEQHMKTNEEGEFDGFETDEHDYYWLSFKRQDGVVERHDVWSMGELNKYTIGQRLVVKYIVGGKSKNEYYQGFDVFVGAESK